MKKKLKKKAIKTLSSFIAFLTIIALSGLFNLSITREAKAADWVTETVDNEGSVGLYLSLALDSSNNPQISYYDSTNTALKYTHKSGDGWVTETVDSAEDVGWYPSLALDSSNNPQISYYDFTNKDLKYTHKSGDGWVTETVDSVGDVGWDSTTVENLQVLSKISEVFFT